MLRITAAIPDKIVVVIVHIKTTYFVLSRGLRLCHDNSKFMYKTPEVGAFLHTHACVHKQANEMWH